MLKVNAKCGCGAEIQVDGDDYYLQDYRDWMRTHPCPNRVESSSSDWGCTVIILALIALAIIGKL